MPCSLVAIALSTGGVHWMGLGFAAASLASRAGFVRFRSTPWCAGVLRKGISFGNTPAHHGVDLKRTNPARLAREAAAKPNPIQWTPPVLSAIATKEQGIDELVSALDRHFAYLQDSGTLRA